MTPQPHSRARTGDWKTHTHMATRALTAVPFPPPAGGPPTHTCAVATSEANADTGHGGKDLETVFSVADARGQCEILLPQNAQNRWTQTHGALGYRGRAVGLLRTAESVPG